MNINYAIGQCWISHTESTLGVGKIQKIENRQIELYFLLADESRIYAADNAPLTRVRYSVNQQIHTLEHNKLLVMRVDEKNHLLSYLITDDDDNQYTICESQLNPVFRINNALNRLLNAQYEPNKWFEARKQTYFHKSTYSQSPLAGLLAGRIDLIPHQFYIIYEVARRYAPRVLLADEVGLGKTIESGAIIHHQLFTEKVSRVLIIVPDSLIHQWLVEMLRRFNLTFSLLDKQRYKAEIEQENFNNPFDCSQLVICSLNFLVDNSDIYQQCFMAHWDLMVVDEAHHLQWNKYHSSLEYQCIEQLSLKIASVLLLTATPEQLGKESHFARLRMLDPARYHDYDQFIEEEKYFQPLATIINKLLENDLSSVKPLLKASTFQEDEELIHEVESLIKEKSGERERKVHKLVSKLLDYHGTGRLLFRNTRVSVKGFTRRKLFAYPLNCPDEYHNNPVHHPDLMTYLCPEVRYKDSMTSQQENWLSFDPRIQWLINFCQQNPKEKIVLITALADTVKDIHIYCKQRLNIMSSAFHEHLSLMERDRAAAFFADPESRCQLLLCSEIGSEGRNFQFVHQLVLFDLPKNPDLLEQRIGRLDRIGQTQDVTIHVPYLQNTAQELLYHWFHHGLNAFELSCHAAYQVYQTVKDELSDLIKKSATNSFRHEKLIKQSAQLTQDYNHQLELGRDKLLEYNSSRPYQSQSLIEMIVQQDNNTDLMMYLDKAFDCLGLEDEPYRMQSRILKNTNKMPYSFDLINEQGMAYTLDRKTALANEDISYISWEHPLILDIMDRLINNEMGNTAIISFSQADFQPGNMFLECFYVLDLPQHKKLSSSIFQTLSESLIVNSHGDDVTKQFNNMTFIKHRNNLNKTTGNEIIKAYQQEILEMYSTADKYIKDKIKPKMIKLYQKQRANITVELERLLDLQQINPSVRKEEIKFFETLLSEIEIQYEQLQIRLDAVRILIST